jgi:hypothetical protein
MVLMAIYWGTRVLVLPCPRGHTTRQRLLPEKDSPGIGKIGVTLQWEINAA